MIHGLGKVREAIVQLVVPLLYALGNFPIQSADLAKGAVYSGIGRFKSRLCSHERYLPGLCNDRAFCRRHPFADTVYRGLVSL